VITEGVDATPVEREDALRAGGDTEFAALAAVLGDNERGPRHGRPESHGNWTDRHSLFAFGCGTRHETSRGYCDPRRSRVRDLLALASFDRSPAASAEGPAPNRRPSRRVYNHASRRRRAELGVVPMRRPAGRADATPMQLLLTGVDNRYFCRPIPPAFRGDVMAYCNWSRAFPRGPGSGYRRVR